MPRIPRNTIYWVRGDDERVNTTYLLDVPVSSVTNGQIVRFDGTNYVTAVADGSFRSRAVGVIVNVSGSTGDLIVANGKVTGYSGLITGSTYYLHPTISGTLTANRPEHGLIVTVGVALNATTLLVDIRSEEANPNIRRAQSQSGCSTGQIVRWDPTALSGAGAYVPASATNVNQHALGLIVNVSGNTGDVYFRGPAPTTNLTVTAGQNYYLSTTAGAITNVRPMNGYVVNVGHALSSTVIDLNFNQIVTDNPFLLTPINYANKQAFLSFWKRVSGSGTMSFDASSSTAMGYGSYSITGTGVWEAIIDTVNVSDNSLSSTHVRSHYPVSPTQGIGGTIQARVSSGTATVRCGCRFYDRDLNYLTPATNQEYWLLNSSSFSAASFSLGYFQAVCKNEGASINQMPSNSRFIRAVIAVDTNPGTVWFDNFTLYALSVPSVMSGDGVNLGLDTTKTKTLRINPSNSNGANACLQLLGSTISAASNSSYSFQVNEGGNSASLVFIKFGNSSDSGGALFLCQYSNGIIKVSGPNNIVIGGATPLSGLAVAYDSLTGILTVRTDGTAAVNWSIGVTCVG